MKVLLRTLILGLAFALSAQGQESEYWAQERIGLDLVKADAGLVKDIVSGLVQSVAVLDGSSSNLKLLSRFSKTDPKTVIFGQPSSGQHADLVSSLFFDAEVGAALNASLDLIALGRYEPENRISQIQAFAESNARLGNASISFDNVPAPQLEAALAKIANQTSSKTLVIASGNHFPSTGVQDQVFVKRPEVVTVGNLNIDGILDPTSAQGQHVTVVAPAGESILSKQASGEKAVFGGTSAAAPLTAGVLANVLSLLPEISNDELAILLNRTSIRTLIQKLGSRDNGSGMINAYLLLKVAQRIKWERQQAGTPIKALLETPRTFDFSRESHMSYLQYKTSGQLNDLRKAFYLKPTQELAGELAEANLQRGKPDTAAFFSSLTLNPKTDLGGVYEFLMKSKSQGDSYYANDWNVVGRDGVIMMNRLKSNDHPLVTMFLNDIKERIKKSKSDPELIEAAKLISFLNHERPEIEEAFSMILDRVALDSLNQVLEAIAQTAPGLETNDKTKRETNLVMSYKDKINQAINQGIRIPEYLKKLIQAPTPTNSCEQIFEKSHAG